MTVKLVLALRKRDNVSTEQFSEFCRNERGPQVAGAQTTLNLAKYTHVHRKSGNFEEGLRASRPNLVRFQEPPLDLVEEYYFDETLIDFQSRYSLGTSTWSQLKEASSEWLDYSTSYLYLVDSRPFVLPSKVDTIIASEYNHITKAIAFTIATDEAGIHYWNHNHATLTQTWAASLGLEKYAQDVPYRSDIADRMRIDYGFASSPYDMCAMTWFNERYQTGQAYAAALEAIRKDEDTGFMRPNAMTVLAGKEHIFVDKFRSW